MAAAAITVDLSGLDTLRERVAALASADLHDLLDAIGTELVDVTVERFTTKTAPNGAPWRPWSPRYARTRHAGHSLLVSDSHLIRSIQQLVSGGTVAVGSNLVYAAAHQFGTPRIPARPYLGLSEDDRQRIEDIAVQFLDDVLGGAT